MTAIGVEIENLPTSTCSDDFTCDTVENGDLGGSLNGSYELLYHDGQWYKDLGAFHDDDDPGTLVAYQDDVWDDREECGPVSGLVSRTELYVWRITGSLGCTECEVNEEPGLKWSGGVGFSYQCRVWRNPDFYGGDGKWAWYNSCDFLQVFWMWCGNVRFNIEDGRLVEQPCVAPPGCNGYVVYGNISNNVLEEVEGSCTCTAGSGEATARLYPIGTTASCTE